MSWYCEHTQAFVLQMLKRFIQIYSRIPAVLILKIHQDSMDRIVQNSA